MAESETTTRRRPPSMAEINAAQHEIIMAYATKSAKQGAQTAKFAERSAGANSGEFYVSFDLVQREDEEDVQFLGRIMEFGRKAIDCRDELNAYQSSKRDNGEGGEKS